MWDINSQLDTRNSTIERTLQELYCNLSITAIFHHTKMKQSMWTCTLRGNILCEPATFHHNCTTRCTTAACKIASSSSCRPTATTASIKATEKETIYWSTYDTSPRRIALFQTSYKYTSIQQESREEQWINLLVTWKNKGVTHSTVSVWFKDSKGLSIL